MTIKQIALLATGDEIVDGTILNTNAQAMAITLFNEQIHVGEHRIVRDNEAKITETILSLLQNHDALIITGGLGPTTDDRTRFALAKALNRKLILNEKNWQAIINRMAQRYGVANIPLSNQQQALFPEGVEILDNPHGTAAGCLSHFENKFIFMLPGPPSECMPMFNQYVLPILKENQFGQESHFKNWLLFGVSEGHIAEKLELALSSPGSLCRTGYRVTFPYLEFKLFSTTQAELQKSIEVITPILAPYLLSDSMLKASELLKNNLREKSQQVFINDQVTGGYLEQVIRIPELNSQLYFNHHIANKLSWNLELTGLTEYWQSTPNTNSTILQLTLLSPTGERFQEIKQFPNYQQRNPLYAAEYACQFLLRHCR